MVSCNVDYVCRTPNNQTVDEGDSWTQYGAWQNNPPLFGFCSGKGKMTLQIYDGGWITVTSSTKIKVTSGSNPVNVFNQIGSCNPNSSPRATWTLEANTGSGGSAWLMRIKVRGNTIGYSSNWTITVNTPTVVHTQAMVIQS